MKFGQSKELFSSVPSLINYFKTAVSKRKDPLPVPAPAVTSNIDNRNYNKSVTVSGATQNNGISPQVVKRVSRFAPIASAATTGAGVGSTDVTTNSNTNANVNTGDSFSSLVRKFLESYQAVEQEEGSWILGEGEVGARTYRTYQMDCQFPFQYQLKKCCC